MSEAKRTRLYEKGWKYTKSGETDIARTFAKIKRQLKEAEAAKEPAKNIAPIKRRA